MIWPLPIVIVTIPESLEQAARHWGDLVGARITIIALDGTVLGEFLGKPSNRWIITPTEPEVIQALAEGQGKSIRYSNTTGYEMLYYAKLVTAKEQPVAVLRLALPLQAIDAKDRQPSANPGWYYSPGSSSGYA